MPERLVRQRRGLVDLYRITSSQRAEHAAVFLFRGSHFTTLGNDVPRVARDGRARRLREGLSCCSREDGEHLCCSAAASANSGAVESSFFCGGSAGPGGPRTLVQSLRVVERSCKTTDRGGNAVSFAPAVDKCAMLPLLGRPRWGSVDSPRCRTRPFPGVSESKQTERRMSTANRAGASAAA